MGGGTLAGTATLDLALLGKFAVLQQLFGQSLSSAHAAITAEVYINGNDLNELTVVTCPREGRFWGQAYGPPPGTPKRNPGSPPPIWPPAQSRRRLVAPAGPPGPRGPARCRESARR